MTQESWDLFITDKRPKTNEKIISVRMTEESLELLEQLSKTYEIPKSTLARNLIEYMLIKIPNSIYLKKWYNNTNKSNISDTIAERSKTMSKTNTKKSTDKRIFKHTAATTKVINIKPKIARGGIRL